jgi:transcriptional repressor OPI1
VTEYSSPQQSQIPLHVHTQTSFGDNETQPLLTLFTSQYPLAGNLINGSLYAYKTTQSFIPGAQWTERNIGMPIATTAARISGVEGGLRWYLQPKKGDKAGTPHPQTPDVEKGPAAQGPYGEDLPAYEEGGRSPPYSEQLAALPPDQRQPPPGWRQQLMISTSGLSIAMSEESLRSLRFCLEWLRWANGRLGESIQNLKVLLERYGATDSAITQPPREEHERYQAAMNMRIATLKKDVLETIKQVVNIVSQYAGGALPENARNLVHRHLTSLPQRFSIANSNANQDQSNSSEAAKSAGRVMLLAQEGLDMMTQVSRVVNDTLTSAEGWCEKLGKRTGREGSQQQVVMLDGEKSDQHARRSETVRSGTVDGDVKMDM